MKRKIIPNQKYTTYAAFPLVTGDVRAYEIQLDLGENVENAEFKVTAFRSDGEVIEDLGTVEDGVCRYTMQNNMYSVPGELTVRLAVVHDSSVLTDREIIFEVLSGSKATTEPSTAVDINNSVILRISALEEKLLLKVDKQDGKDLSKNDFTDDYKQKLDDLVCGVSSVNDKTGDVVIGKEDVGLSNVDNTSDLDKPVSNATKEALDLKADKETVTELANTKADVTYVDGRFDTELFDLYKDVMTEIDNTNGNVTHLEERIDSKADAGELSDLGGRVAGAESGIESLNETVTELANTKADVTYVDGRVNEECQNLRDDIDKNALKGSASGEAIYLNDVTPVEHMLDVKLSSDSATDLSVVTLSTLGKNLVTYPYSKSGTSEVNDVTFTVNEDGSIVANGTASETFSFVFVSPSTPIKLKSGIKYTLSGCPEGGAYSGGYYLAIQTTDYTTTQMDIGNGVTFTATEKPIYLYISVGKGATLNNLVFRPQIELGESATEYESYIPPATYTPSADGIIEGVQIILPNMTLTTDTDGVVIDCKYNKDVNKVIETLTNAIISLGGNV